MNSIYPSLNSFEINNEIHLSEIEINTKSLELNNKLISIPIYDFSIYQKTIKEEKENCFLKVNTSNFISGEKSSCECFSINNSNTKSLFIENNKNKDKTNNKENNIKVFSLIEKNNPEKKDNIKLIISDFEDCDFFNGKKIEINSLGYEKGFRNQKDGFVFFGSCKKENGIIINDIIINSNINIKRLFVIFYKNQSFFIKANFENINQENYYTYFKISEKNNLISKKKKNFFQIGNSLFNTEIKEDNIINIKINSDKNVFSFSPNNYSYITIGRDEKNLIRIDDKLISKWHCIIIYNFQNKNWNISDKKSTNGTWKFCNEKIELINDVNYVKIGKNIIQIQKVLL